MRSIEFKQKKCLMLVLVLAVLSVGCSKQSPESSGSKPAQPTVNNSNAPETYQEAVEAYQSGKFSAAADKFRVLAEQGDASSQYNLGTLYRQGQGVPQDDKQAVLWWAKAAEQGHTDAMDNLGLRYAKGEGIDQDWVQAYKWFSIAGMRKNVSAASNAKVAASKMTQVQIEQGQSQAKEWMVQHQQ